MSEVASLRKEIAELRKQISAMAVAMAELAARQAPALYQPIQYVPYTPPAPYPNWITYTTSIDAITTN